MSAESIDNGGRMYLIIVDNKVVAEFVHLTIAKRYFKQRWEHGPKYNVMKLVREMRVSNTYKGALT